MMVKQGIFYANFSVKMIRTFQSYLNLLRYRWESGFNDLFNSSWLFDLCVS